MTTQNKHVACYLPPDIEQWVTDYAYQHGITRKDSNPRLGSAIVEILREYFTEYSTHQHRYITKYGTQEDGSNTSYGTQSCTVTLELLQHYLEGVCCPVPTEYATESNTKSNTEYASKSNTKSNTEYASKSDTLTTQDVAGLVGRSTSTVKTTAKQAVKDGSFQFSKGGMTFKVSHQPQTSNESWKFEQIE